MLITDILMNCNVVISYMHNALHGKLNLIYANNITTVNIDSLRSRRGVSSYDVEPPSQYTYSKLFVSGNMAKYIYDLMSEV